MDSLQWIDSHAQSVERKLQEVSRLAELHRSDGERLQRSNFDWTDKWLTEQNFILTELFH